MQKLCIEGLRKVVWVCVYETAFILTWIYFLLECGEHFYLNEEEKEREKAGIRFNTVLIYSIDTRTFYTSIEYKLVVLDYLFRMHLNGSNVNEMANLMVDANCTWSWLLRRLFFCWKQQQQQQNAKDQSKISFCFIFFFASSCFVLKFFSLSMHWFAP